MKRFGIKQGDCIEVMKSMKNDSVDFTLTDIPYNEVNRQSNGLRDLDKQKADVICGNCRTVKMCIVSGKDEKECKEKIKEEWNKRYKEVK